MEKKSFTGNQTQSVHFSPEQRLFTRCSMLHVSNETKKELDTKNHFKQHAANSLTAAPYAFELGLWKEKVIK